MQPEAILERFHNHIEEVIRRTVDEYMDTVESSVLKLFDKYTERLPATVRSWLETELNQTINEFKNELTQKILDKIENLTSRSLNFAISSLGKRLFKSGDICAVFIHGYEICLLYTSPSPRDRG